MGFGYTHVLRIRIHLLYYKHCVMLAEIRNSIWRLPNRKYLVFELVDEMSSKFQHLIPMFAVSHSKIGVVRLMCDVKVRNFGKSKMANDLE